MDAKEQVSTQPTTSKLSSVMLGFEYDKTLREVKRDVRVRTHNNL